MATWAAAFVVDLSLLALAWPWLLGSGTTVAPVSGAVLADPDPPSWGTWGGAWGAWRAALVGLAAARLVAVVVAERHCRRAFMCAAAAGERL